MVTGRPGWLLLYSDGDLAFHSGIARATGNDALRELYELFCQNIRVHLRQSLLDP